MNSNLKPDDLRYFGSSVWNGKNKDEDAVMDVVYAPTISMMYIFVSGKLEKD